MPQTAEDTAHPGPGEVHRRIVESYAQVLEGRLACEDFREARVQRHALFFQSDRNFENFTRRRHRER